MPTIRCTCTLNDCAYWNAAPGTDPAQCDCSHPDKQHYMRHPCPLYRKDWAGKDPKSLAERFVKKKRR